MTASLVFWCSLGLIVYTYAGFPLVVLARARLRPRPHSSADVSPAVSMVIAAYNEAATIGAKLDSLLALAYPPDRLEILVASDGSDDDTDDIVRAHAARAGSPGPAIRLLSLPREGKAAALTAAVPETRGDILAFSDANSILAPPALRSLVRPFADPAVGGVAGDQRYLAADAGGIAAGERSYWSFDRLLKSAESRGGSVVSATGTFYAIRREHFEPVPSDVTDDFFVSTGVIAHGARLVFEPDAVAYEPVAPSSGIEFGRKVRVMTRGLRGVGRRRGLLDPRRHGFYALQLFSHKVLRRLMVFPLVATAAVTPFLWDAGVVYQVAAVGQAAVYGLGGLGVALARTRLGHAKIIAVPAYFLLVNTAALRAVWNITRGRRIERWQPERAAAAEGTRRVATSPLPPVGEDSP